MFSLVQFVFPNNSAADDLAVRGRPLELYGGPYCRFEVPKRPEQLVPQDDGAEPLDDEDDRELLESLTALYWFRRQEPLEDEE